MATLQLGINSQKAQQNVNQLNVQLNVLIQNITNVRQAVGGLDRQFNSTSGFLVNFTKRFIAFTVAFKTAQFIKESINVLKDFELTLARIRGALIDPLISGDEQAKEFETIRKAALEIGQTTRFSAQEAAEGFLILTKAGLDAKDSVEALPAIFRLASIGQIEVAKAADIATGAIIAFGESFDQTSRFVDIFNLAANKSKAEIAEIGISFRDTAPIVEKLGGTAEELAGVFGVLAQSNIRGTKAGTDFRSMLRTLLEPTAQQAEQLREVGISLEEVNPAVVGVIKPFERLAQAQLNTIEISRLFERRNLASALTIIKNTDALKTFISQLDNSKGVSEEASKVIEDTLDSKFKKFGNTLQEIVLKQGDAGLLGFLKSMADVANDTARSISGLNDEVRKLNHEKEVGVDIRAPWQKFLVPLADPSVVERNRRIHLLKDDPFEALAQDYLKKEDDNSPQSLYAKAMHDRAMRLQRSAVERTVEQLYGKPKVGLSADDLYGLETPEQKRAKEHIESGIERYKKEIEVISKSSDERERLIELFDIEDKARLHGVGGIQEEVNEYEQLIEQLQRLTAIRRAADEIGGAFADSLDAMLLRINKIRDNLKALLLDITKIALHNLVTQPIGAQIANAVTAIGTSIANSFGTGSGGKGVPVSDQHELPAGAAYRGGAFSAGIQTFAYGGVVSRPTYFGMAGDRYGLMGEAGEEGVLPLRRGRDGKLGVASVGGEGKNVTIVMHVHASDANSFRKSRRQIISDLKKAI